MEITNQSLSQQEWKQVKNWFHELMDVPTEQLETTMEKVTNDPRLQLALKSMLEVYHDSFDKTITPSQSAATTVLENSTLKAGDHFSKYLIIKAIGSGGMGQVYLGQRDDEVIQQVAIKILNQNAMDAQGLARFDTERRILASLEHPNIARLIDAGSELDQAYYVMEYVEGQAIDQYAQTNNLNLNQRLKLFQQICEAVSFAHNNLIVHRDLKPCNILVTKHGEVKLLDFGIAKPLRTIPGTKQIHETLVGTTAMTPLFAAPEQIKGERITVSTDVYVLGLLLYCLLTDQYAFELEGKTWGEIEHVINQELPVLPSKILSKTKQSSPNWSHKLKGDLDAIVLHALKKEPSQRYQSVREMSVDVGHYLNNEPLHIKRSQTIYRLKKTLRKHWLPIGALSTVFAVLAVSSVLIWQQSHIISNERDKALTEKRRALTEKRVAEEVTTFLVDTFKSADPTKSLGTELTAGDILRQGVSQLQQQQSTPEVKNRLLSAMSEVYFNLSAIDEAGELISQISDETVLSTENQQNLALVKANVLYEKGQVKEGLQIINALEFPERNEMYFKAETLKAFLMGELDQIYEGIELLKQLVEQARGEFGEHSMIYAIQLREYAQSISDPDEINLTLEMLHQSVQIMEGLGDKVDVLEYLETKRTLMIEYRRNREYEKALSISDELERQYIDIYSTNHTVLASLYNSRGIIYSKSDQLQKSLESYLKSKELYLKSLGENSTRVVSVEMNIGVLYLYYMSDPGAAEPHLASALNKLIKTVGKRKKYYYINVSYAFCLVVLDQLEKAKLHLNESIRYYQENDADDVPINILAKSLMAHVLISKGEYQQAHDIMYPILPRLIKHWGNSIHRDMINEDVAALEKELNTSYDWGDEQKE